MSRLKKLRIAPENIVREILRNGLNFIRFTPKNFLRKSGNRLGIDYNQGMKQYEEKGKLQKISEKISREYKPAKITYGRFCTA